VLLLACPGYTSRQGLEWLRRDIAALRPDIVTACFGWNDVRAAGLPDSHTMPSPGGQVFVRRVMARSQLLLHLAESARDKSQRGLPQSPVPRNSSEEYVGHFAEMAALSSQHGAWFGIILPVYRDPNTPGDYPEMKNHPGDVGEGERMTRYRAALREHAVAGNVPFLEIRELTEAGWPANSELFGERIHPNAAGHRLMAGRITDFLAPAIAAKLPAK
jgi:lysophospholipase L1-like esterase